MTPKGESGYTKVFDIDFASVKILHQVQPNYPPLARMTHTQGSVVLLMTIDTQGVPIEVRAISSPNASLEAESVRVARLWRFEPARVNGQPVNAQFRLTLNFRLN